MQSLTVPIHCESSPLVTVNPPRVYLDGDYRADIRLRCLRLETAPRFGSAELLYEAQPTVASPAGLPRIGQSVLIRPSAGEGRSEFHGRVVSTARVETGGESSWQVGVESALAGRLGRFTGGRRARVGDKTVWQAVSRLSFNTTPDERMSVSVHTFSRRACRLFQSGGERWNVGEVLAYVFANHAPQDLDVPDREECLCLAGHVDAGECTIATGQGLGDLLGELADRAGLRLRAVRVGLGLALYRPGRHGRRLDLSRQQPGSLVRPGLTTVGGLDSSTRAEEQSPPIRLRGAVKRYESTFELQPGWTTPAEVPAYHETTLSEASSADAQLYRTWVLNEHGRHDDVAAFDCSSLSAEDFLMDRARRFEPCVSIDDEGRSRGIVVEYRTGAEGTWRSWPGVVHLAGEQCAVTLAEAFLPSDYFQAVQAGEASLRVTASVASDRRVEVFLPGNPSAETEVRDLPAQAGWGAVCPGSLFAPSTTQTTVLVDGTPCLRRLAESMRQSRPRGRSWKMELPWCDLSVSVGARVESATGRTSALASGSDEAHVFAVEHEFEDVQRTWLWVEA